MGDTKPALTGLRGLAAAFVVLSHSVEWGPWPEGPEVLHLFDGQIGVLLFFCLSGWLMGFKYLGEAFILDSVKRYAYARAGRVAPLYYLICVLMLILSSWDHTIGVQPDPEFTLDSMYFVFAFLLVRAPMWIIWTVPVEIHFYVVFVAVWRLWQARTRTKIIVGFAGTSVYAAAICGVYFPSPWLPSFLRNEYHACIHNRVCSLSYMHVFFISAIVGASSHQVQANLMLSMAGILSLTVLIVFHTYARWIRALHSALGLGYGSFVVYRPILTCSV